ncbi:type II secretion system protein GspC [Escherichia coli]|nr:type II secretion system protein GspC [Escherichia coli]MBV7621823.1 type II secretion system protein GspC [Escherichia coli]MCV5808834.1 type II secretion system protein GspC [Escherichia coli]HAV2439487.1 type II secretion system protein GspC [Escherichia coli]HBC9536406.1 type II secretion system protein GspC [Escherichia coli]HBL7902747.1 type II secretion system protein GspC [Escherichia coli]
MARVVFRDARIYLIQWLTKIRHTLNQRQSLNTDKEHLRKIARGMFWLMLLIISAKMAYSLWRYFSFSAEYTAVSPSANKPPRADAKTFDKNDVQLISQQNWFGKYQPVATPVKQPEPVPVAETRLNVVLRGIAFGARPGAVIEEGGKQQVYLQGERLGSHNAVIEEINRDHVMLRYQGKIERLSLAEEGHSTVAVTNKKAVSDEAKQAVAEPAASAPVEIPTAVRQALTKDPQKIFNYIQLTPVRKEGIVGYRAELIAESLWEFIDEDRSVQTRLGREDSEYLARSVPFYAANQPLADISEMLVVQGMDAGLYQKLKPLVCALPMIRQQININTLDVTQSVILEALFDPWLSPVQARALLQQRPAKGWEDVDQFLAQPLLADVDERTKKQLKTVLSVDSNYFWLRSDITVNEIELTMNSLIVRMGPQHFSVLWHQTGESE